MLTKILVEIEALGAFADFETVFEKVNGRKIFIKK